MADYLKVDNQLNIPWGRLFFLLSVFLSCPGLRPVRLPASKSVVSWCPSCSALVLGAMLLRLHGCSFPAISRRRQSLIADILFLWLLQSLLTHHYNVPCTLVLYVDQHHMAIWSPHFDQLLSVRIFICCKEKFL